MYLVNDLGLSKTQNGFEFCLSLQLSNCSQNYFNVEKKTTGIQFCFAPDT